MRRAAVLAVSALAAMTSACMVQVTKVKNPGPVFKQAREEAARLSGQPGPARELNVLVWDEQDGELVRVSVPLWMARAAGRSRDCDWDDDDRLGRIRLRGRVRIDDERLWEDIEKMGLGTVAEVESDDGAQVLVWLR